MKETILNEDTKKVIYAFIDDFMNYDIGKKETATITIYKTKKNKATFTLKINNNNNNNNKEKD